jgi:leucyl/phenylalanyl-tRNA---protein transferase
LFIDPTQFFGNHVVLVSLTVLYKMPLYRLNEDLIFPSAELANEDGLLAIGGDLSPTRLLLAYENGIFPWYSKNEPILWWSPNPRFVLFLEKLHVSRSMERLLSKNTYTITFDTAFDQVIDTCSKIKRAHQKGTWITKEMLIAYKTLHQIGVAHSAEAWHHRELCGGIYGISLGGCFFGESMFSTKDNASKAAMITLVRKLKEKDFGLLDCQVYSNHLKSLGAEEIDRTQFLKIIKEELKKDSVIGKWADF